MDGRVDGSGEAGPAHTPAHSFVSWPVPNKAHSFDDDIGIIFSTKQKKSDEPEHPTSSQLPEHLRSD
jgi:hypothetical protein